MKKLLILFFLFPILLPAQEKYFHELKGMEDSTGTTHLFYRLYEKIPYQCSEEETGELIYNTYNDIYHMNTSTLTDSIRFYNYYKPWCLYGYVDSERISDYDFYNNDPTKWIIQTTLQSCFPYPVSDFSGRLLNVTFSCLTKPVSSHNTLLNTEIGFVLSNKEDSLYYNDMYGSSSFKVAIKEDFSPNFNLTSDHNYDEFQQYVDSAGIEFGVAAIHPGIDSLLYSINYEGHLLLSEKFSSSFSLTDTTGSYYQIAFDSDHSTLYSIVNIKENNTFIRTLKKSSNFGKVDSWEFLTLPENLNMLQYLVTDSEIPNHLFIADSTLIFQSINAGETFALLSEMEYQITGLYKKPGSNILYVLTTDELFEINTETKAVISLKKLPVYNEESEEVPSSVKLHQNYPNPFNPSTTISFELDKPTEVTLTIFDALGRTISVLVDGRTSSGLHEISFDASSLSSGIYFYRLETGAFFETKRFTLIK